MTPRDQAIEDTAKAIYTKSGRIGWDGQLEVHKRIWLDQARDYVDAYESARARLDGAKMMPREATEEMLSAGDSAIPRAEPDETGIRMMGREVALQCYRAMHDATPKEGT